MFRLMSKMTALKIEFFRYKILDSSAVYFVQTIHAKIILLLTDGTIYYGMSTEVIIIAGCTWSLHSLYYGFVNFRDSVPSIVWKQITTS